MNVTNTVKNQGGAGAGAFTVGVYLSPDNVFVRQRHAAELASGAEPGGGRRVRPDRDPGRRPGQPVGGLVLPDRACRYARRRWRKPTRRTTAWWSADGRPAGPDGAVGDRDPGGDRARRERERDPRGEERGCGGRRGAHVDLATVPLDRRDAGRSRRHGAGRRECGRALAGGAMATVTKSVQIPIGTAPGQVLDHRAGECHGLGDRDRIAGPGSTT